MSSVDDIILNSGASKKKKGKGILVILFLLFLILIGLAGAYWYFTNYMQETPKTAFFKYVGQNNFSNILNTDIYYTMFDKMDEQSYKSEITADFTTTMKNDLTESVDVSKLEFILNLNSDKENEASLFDAKLNYSSNDLFNVKIINTKDSVAIGSTEILDKYVATSKSEYANSIRRTTGLETDISADIVDEQIGKISDNKVNLTEEYKTQKINEYSELIINSIPEEAVTENENVVVTIDSKTINTKAYTLALDSNKYKEILTSVLTNLKNDQELLGKIVTGTESAEETGESEKSSTVNPLPNVQVDYTGAETEEHQTSAEFNTEPIAEEPQELQIVQDFPDENLVRDENIVYDENSDYYDIGGTSLEEEETLENKSNLFNNLISALILGQKIEGRAEDLINDINLELENAGNLNEGIKITVYVRNEEEQPEETVKLIAELPNLTSIDIEYQTENKFKITYLEDITGNSIKVERTSSDVQTKFNIELNDIEDKKVIAKTQIELETEGSKSSKDYTNELIVKYNDSEGDWKVNVKNTIDFTNTTIEETLTDENAIFVDKLTDEDAALLYTQIFEKVLQVYGEKLISLAFIDNNSSTSLIQQPTVNPEERNEVRQKLIETVSSMMGEAQANGTEFSIQNLQDLRIEGYNVSCIVTEEKATIKINGYTFEIDKDFMLSE